MASTHSGRVVVIVGTEFRPFCFRTGLAEFSGLAPVLLETGIWTAARLFLPEYRGLQARLTAHALRTAGNRVSASAVGAPIYGVSVSSNGSLSGVLPVKTSVWNTFAHDVIDQLQTIGQPFDIIATSFIAGPLFERLRAANGRLGSLRGSLVITLDLVEQDEAACKLLWEGIDAADRLHVPTTSWWSRIQTAKHPAIPTLTLKSYAKKTVILPFGNSTN